MKSGLFELGIDLGAGYLPSSSGARADLEIVVYPGNLVLRIYLSLRTILKNVSEYGPFFNILLSRFKIL